jgi:hypothetical protein
MTHKQPVPESIEAKMCAWRREGFSEVPSEYVAFHKQLAEPALAALVSDHRLTVHRTYEDFDGWGDGMRVLHAIVEEPNGRLVKLSWHDGNQEFFEHGAGSWPYKPNGAPQRGLSPLATKPSPREHKGNPSAPCLCGGSPFYFAPCPRCG